MSDECSTLPRTAGAEASPVVPPILTPALLRLLVALVGSAFSFYLLLSVVPLYLDRAGAGGAGAGLAMGVMMLATVLTEVAVPRMLSGLGQRAVLALGLVLMGAPALVLPLSSGLPLVLTVCLARGAGLAILVVAGTALVAELVPTSRRAEGLGLYGVVVGAPAVVGLPLGVYLSSRIGFDPVFVIAAASSLVGLVMLPGLPGAEPAASRAPHVPILRGLGGSGLLRPAMVFAAVTFTAGVVVTFLPLAVTTGHSVVPMALLAQSLVTPIARWAAGRYGDRFGSRRFLVPSILVSAIGAAALMLVDRPAMLIGGMLLFGIGFGAAQNVTLAVMFERAPAQEYGRVSAVWNIAFDAGMGIGAIGFGAVVGWTGYPLAFGLTALVLGLAVIPAVKASAA
ncbi:MAG TPA: MFS transporter [Kribbella sp.]|nr:MFS transporter [Kribbella sp.]